MISKKKISFYVLILVIVLFLTLLINSYLNLIRYRFVISNTDDTLSHKALIAVASIYDAGLTVWNSMEVAIFDNNSLSKESALREIHLQTSANAFKIMASNLPKSAKEKYYDGKMKYPDGSWKKISLRFRGRNIWHWHPDKPSLRLKLKKSEPLNLHRHINLINPEDLTMIANYYGEILGQKLGVLTHKTEMVRVFVNDIYHGVYQMTTREGENMLRYNRRLPGLIYVGHDLKKIWKVDQFEILGDLEVLNDIDPMKILIDAIYAPQDSKRYERMWSILDMEKMFAWIALLNLSGGIHTDFKHNHSYYFDPSIGKLEPVTSDLLALGTLLYPGARDRLIKKYYPDHKLSINEKLHPLLDAALRDPHFYHERNKKLFTAIIGIASTEKQQVMLENLYQQIDPDVLADRRKAFVMETFSGFFRIPYSNRQYAKAKQDILKWVKARNKFLLEELEKSKIEIKIAPDNTENILALISIDGHSAAIMDLTKIHPDSVEIGKIDRLQFSRLKERKLTLFPGLQENQEYYFEQTKDRRVPKHYLLPDKQYYLFRFSAYTVDEVRRELTGIWQNAITGSSITSNFEILDYINPSKISYNKVSQHIWTFPKEKLDDIVLGPGRVELKEDLISLPGQKIRILAGTKIFIGPKISLVSQGALIIEGTQKQPVHIQRLDKNAAWGVIAAHGKKTSGSKIYHAFISGGSIDFLLNVKYSGMVSFLWSRDLEIINTSISSNIEGDDALHMAHSQGTIQGLQISKCFADCIDLDYSNFNLEQLEIFNSGNDGLDLMSSKVKISNSIIKYVGDKGISVGEDSELLVNQIQIIKAVIGIAAKDLSKLDLYDVTFKDNDVAIDAYRKNWRYGGAGKVDAFNSKWENNIIDIRVADDAFVNVFDGVGAKSLVKEQGEINLN